MAVNLYGIRAENLYVPEPLEKKTFLFSAGEVQVRLPDLIGCERLIIESRYPDSQDILEIALIVNAAEKFSGFSGFVTVFLPYLPYSRQDRVCYPGEANSLEAFVSLLAAQQSFKSKGRVITWDVHSKKAHDAFRGAGISFLNIGANALIKKFGDSVDASYVVASPDAGAVDRANAVASTLGCKTVVYGKKKRDSNDGSIIGTLVKDKNGDEPDLSGNKVLIVDDICDGGRTFIELAKVLRNCGAEEVVLYVTHGIFSKGFNVFNENGSLLINRILTPNLFPGIKFPTEESYTVGCHEVPPLVPIVQVLPPPLSLTN
jgi:ribose-phosphate pyrophosphokinase